MRCRFYGPLDHGSIPVFEQREPRAIVWVLDDTLTWEARTSQRVFLTLNDVACFPDISCYEARLLHERFIARHMKPFLNDEGVLTIVHRGNGFLGLGWSEVPLRPAEGYFRHGLKANLPVWWNAAV